MAEGDQLMEQLSNFLNSSEGMAQLQNAAQMLGLGAQNPAAAGQGDSGGKPALANGGGMDLGAMLSAMAKPAQGGAQAPSGLSEGGGMEIDPQMLLKMMKLMQTANRETPSSGLLRALKPLLREERRGKVDEAIRMVQLFSLLPLLKEGLGQ